MRPNPARAIRKHQIESRFKTESIQKSPCKHTAVFARCGAFPLARPRHPAELNRISSCH
jgi:hypothetical protein